MMCLFLPSCLPMSASDITQRNVINIYLSLGACLPEAPWLSQNMVAYSNPIKSSLKLATQVPSSRNRKLNLMRCSQFPCHL
jgi:hypothetical protein